MRRTDIITVASMFGVIMALAGLHLAGRERWVGYATLGLLSLFIAVALIRSVRRGKRAVARPLMDGNVVNDLYLGATYRGPRHVASPRGKHTELVIDDDERLQFLQALDDADARSDRGGSEE